MNIAAQGQHVLRARLAGHAKQTAASSGVAVPTVGVNGASQRRVHTGGADLCALRQHAPPAAGRAHALRQPGFLLGTQHGAGGVVTLVAGQHNPTTAPQRVSTGLRAAELAAIQRPHVHQLPPLPVLVNALIGPTRPTRPHRHVFKIGLVGCRTPGQKNTRLVVGTVLVGGVVIVHFVVVPGAHPGVGSMATAQIGIRLVKCVALAIRLQGFGHTTSVRTQAVRGVGALVYVVTHEEHQVEVLAGHVNMGSVAPLLVVLTRGQRQPQPCHVGIQRRCRACAPHRAHGIAATETVPIVPVRAQPVDSGMHAPGAGRMGDKLALSDWLFQRLVVINFIADNARMMSDKA